MLATNPRYAYLALALVLALPFTGCMSYTEVDVLGVRDARITRLDAKGLNALVDVEIANPNNYKIQVMDPDVDLFVNGMAVGKATMDSVLVLSARSTRTYRLPLRATFQGNASVLPMLLGSALRGNMLLKAQGTVVGKARALRKRFPFEVEHRLELQ